MLEVGYADDLLDDYEAGQLAEEFDFATPQEVIAWALERWGRRVALFTSFQAEGMAILDMAWRIDPGVRVFTVDTGRLPQETYDMMDEVRHRYGISVEVQFPDTEQVENMVRKHGPNLFKKSVPARLLCCNVRKVEPLRKALEDLSGWMTGLRREQWASRANIRKIEIDHDHGGLIKVNPLADWTEEEVWEYVRANNVPSNTLYDQGYKTIGCDPCTRPVEPGAEQRSGRWWWEKGAPKECGMHCAVETGGFEHELEVIVGRRD